MNTLQARRQALFDALSAMTHRQLVRFGRTLTVPMGDYMKISKNDLASKLGDYLQSCYFYSGQSDDIMADQCSKAEAKLSEAFPQGIFHKGERTTPPANNAVREVPKASTAPAGDDMAQLAALLAKVAGNNAQPVDANQVRDIVRKELEGVILPVTVNLKTDGAEPRKLEGIHHRRFPQLLSMVGAGLNVWLAGPAGTGKTTAARKCAEALNLPFYFNGAIDNEYKLLGFTDAHGKVVSRPFREAFINGGIYLFDEVDASMAGALLAFNSADMTDKPTPGPWEVHGRAAITKDGCYIAIAYDGTGATAETETPELAEANIALIAEAGTVYHETGMTPRQLLEKVTVVQEGRTEACEIAKAILVQRDELLAALKDLLAIEDARIKTGAFKPNTYGAAIIGAARDAIENATK